MRCDGVPFVEGASELRLAARLRREPSRSESEPLRWRSVASRRREAG